MVGRSVKIKMSPQILLWEGEILNQKVNFKKVSIQLSVIQDQTAKNEIQKNKWMKA